MNEPSNRDQVIVDLLSAGARAISGSELERNYIVFDSTDIPQEKKAYLARKYPGMFPSKYVAWPANPPN
jgi:hypothetical protein